ncbi:unnamed protein product [Thelazia callipaeda]|uniref:PAS domain-containing protein n=1 Tax=Thelazia callipaeda TaxID=103827 RepID=A0A0N5D4S4_THECL|nr:unnamed protein product [Thelazia callipaeda]
MEIQKLRDLLPLSDSMKERLFQLQVMSLACIYIRKQNYLPHVIGLNMQPSLRPLLKQSEGFRALRGFLLMITKYGKIVYISDNASDYLGHSVAEIMCQGDSIYDLIDYQDHERLQKGLMTGPSSASNMQIFPDERMFICRMNLSRTAKRQLQYHKHILMKGRYVHASEYYQTYQTLSTASLQIQPLFAAFCEMLINPENAEMLSIGNTAVFSTVHSMDLTFLHIDCMMLYYLGYNSQALINKSWYQLLHPDHLLEVAYKHRMLIQRKDGSVMCLLRLQAANGSWLWLHTVFTIKDNVRYQIQDEKRLRFLIHITYQVLSEMEAIFLRDSSWIYDNRNDFTISLTDHETSVDNFRNNNDKIKNEFLYPESTPPILTSPLNIKSEPLSSDHIEIDHFVCSFSSVMSAKNCKGLQNSKPKSRTDFSFGNNAEDNELDALPELCLERNIRGPLPDLSGDLDEFFHEMEHPRMTTACPLAAIKLPENVKLITDKTLSPLPFDNFIPAYNRKMPTITKLLQRPIENNSFESFIKSR